MPTRAGHAVERARQIRDYAASYRADYGFEASMVGARQRLLRELIRCTRPTVVVEVGCGSDLLCEALVEDGRSVAQWVIIEPSSDFAERARTARFASGRLDVIEAFAEEAVDVSLATCVSTPDLVICSSLLHEVPDPLELLAAVRRMLGRERGIIHANVPNSRSLHRRLAKRMGLIESEAEPSERNRRLHQGRIYDLARLIALAERAELRVIASGGYFLKPFTHDQMASLPFMSAAMLDGLWDLGRELPDLASEIYVNAQVTA